MTQSQPRYIGLVDDRGSGPTAFKTVPLIDMGPFLEGSEAGKRQVAKAIGTACRETGFFSIVNHGVPVELIERVFEQSRRFHGLPLEEKLKIDLRKSKYHRGYHALQAQVLEPGKKPDLKEAFDMARELPEDHPDVVAGKPFHGPNTWPEGLPGFRETLEEYYARLVDLGRTVCRCFAIDLGLREDFFEDKHTEPLAQLRLLHYPPQDPETVAEQIGAGAHTDYGSVAFLAQDGVGGLQAMNSLGEWIDIPPVHGAFACNVGDIMEIWTNGLYPATRHRVINTSGRERFSQVLFFDPNYDCLVSPLPECCSETNPPRYTPITMGEHLKNMLDSTFQYRQKAS